MIVMRTMMVMLPCALEPLISIKVTEILMKCDDSDDDGDGVNDDAEVFASVGDWRHERLC